MGKDQELIEAARNGDYCKVQKILSQRAKRTGPLASLRRNHGANAQDYSGFSALHHSSVNGHRDIVELLLSHEASTNIVDLQGSSPLHLASWSGNEEIVRLLLTHGPSVPNVNLMNQALETALHLASQYGHVDVVRLLLQNNANPAILNSRQESCLDLACQYGRLETVQLLLDTHPELLATYTVISPSNSRNIFLHTPLNLASRNGHRSVVEVLVKAGYNVNTRTSQGTALHEAALSGKVDVVKALLEASIDVCVTDSQRRTAVDRLSEVGLNTPIAKEIAELIRESLKKSHLKSKGNSPISSPNEQKDLSFKSTQMLDNQRDSYCENHTLSAKVNSSNATVLREILLKGPEFEKNSAPPPKKPPRRILSASPTHSGLSDYTSDNYDLILLSQMGRNKSLDESVYEDRWRRSITCYESQSIDSIDLEYYSLEYPKSESCANSDTSYFNSLNPDEMKQKSKSQHLPDFEDDKFVSVAHIKLRDAKSEQNVCPPSLKLCQSQKEYNSVTSPDNNGASYFSFERTNQQIHPQISPQPNLDIKASNKKIAPPRPKPAIIGPKPTKPKIAPKPKSATTTLKRQGHSCETERSTSSPKSQNNFDINNKVKPESSEPKRTATKSTMSVSKSTSALSPMDVDKEWAGITQFMDSLSVKMGKIEELPSVKGWNSRNNSSGVGCEDKRNNHSKNRDRGGSLGKWLLRFGMEEYEKLLIANGFDDLEFLGGEMLDDNSLLEIGILEYEDRKLLVEFARKLDVSWPTSIHHTTTNNLHFSVDSWLQELHLPQYISTFRKNLYTDPEKLLKIWNDELITVLEIDMIGHRRRILISAANALGIRGGVVSGPKIPSIFDNGIESGTEEVPLPFRDPNHLVSGVSSGLKTSWRHQPETLINGSVTYHAIYVGTSFVHDFSTPAAIQQAIQQIRSQQTAKSNGQHERSGANVVASLFNLNVVMIVSASVVSWYNSITKSLVREHEISCIQCTCLASDDLRHLALVTRATDPASRNHSCHVFRLDSVELATEVILTLGQAFEVAYQLAVAKRKQSRDHKGHMRSKSADQLCTNQLSTIESSYNNSAKSSRNSSRSDSLTPPPSSHYRSQSVIDIPTPPITPTTTCMAIPVASLTTSANNNNYEKNIFSQKESRFPRVQTFTFSSSKNFSRAPIVSKEEL